MICMGSLACMRGWSPDGESCCIGGSKAAAGCGNGRLHRPRRGSYTTAIGCGGVSAARVRGELSGDEWVLEYGGGGGRIVSGATVDGGVDASDNDAAVDTADDTGDNVCAADVDASLVSEGVESYCCS